MDEWIRLLVLGAVALLAATGAWIARRVAARATRPVPAELGPFPAVVFFGSGSCLSCGPALEVLDQVGVVFRQYTWEDDPELFEQLEIEEVPLLWAIDRRGRLRHEIRGVPDRRTIARWELHVPPE